MKLWIHANAIERCQWPAHDHELVLDALRDQIDLADPVALLRAETCVYAAFGQPKHNRSFHNVPIYIGMTKRFAIRMGQHATDHARLQHEHWIHHCNDIEAYHMPDLQTAAQVEATLIHHFSPRFNKIHNQTGIDPQHFRIERPTQLDDYFPPRNRRDLQRQKAAAKKLGIIRSSGFRKG